VVIYARQPVEATRLSLCLLQRHLPRRGIWRLDTPGVNIRHLVSDKTAFAGATRQAELLRAGELSSQELVEGYLRRIDALEPQLTAFRIVYRDRARAEWQRVGDQLQMSTLPLDLDSLIAELQEASELQAEAPAGTRIGHVHLQVADLAEAEAFYHGVLGFDVIVRGYPGALFVSAGGYHHHIGLNTWHSAGQAPAAAGSVGLRSFTIELPNGSELAAVLARLEAARIPATRQADGVLVRDPFGSGVVLTARRRG